MTVVHSRSWRTVAIAVLCVLVAQMVAPIAALAITSGPTAPEFAAFEPIGTTGMVNEFTGSFTYNLPLLEVPGPNGSGYPISLAYHSGATLEEDASWVGFGWTLNPGAINRSVRGFPDDYNGQSITRYNKQDKNETFTVGALASLQVLSNDINFGFEAANRWNTFAGFSVTSGFSLGVANMLTLTATNQNGVTKFSANVNWAKVFTNQLTDDIATLQKGKEALADVGSKELSDAVGEAASEMQQQANTYSAVANYIGSSFYTMSTPTSTVGMGGAMYAISFGGTIAFDPTPTMIGAHLGVKGTYSWQKPDDSATGNSYGYMYDGNAIPGNHFTDYSVERDAQYTTRDRFLSGVYNTYDLFNCNAQGVGGMLRLHHRRPGYNEPRAQSSTKGQFTLGLELGVGPAKISLGGAVSVGGSLMTVAGAIPSGTGTAPAYRHQRIDTSWNNGRAFMRFANDKADNVLYSNNDEPQKFSTALMLIGGLPGVYQSPNNIDTLTRVRQSSSVTFRMNREMVTDSASSGPRYYGYTSRNSYNEKFLNRHEESIKDGIGEVTVTQTSGIRYVFGLPVYARRERSLTFTGRSAFDTVMTTHGLIYGPRTTKAANVSGFSKKYPYATSMLMTEVRTPDYIDRTQNGPSVDDYGGFTHFMYKRAAGTAGKEKGFGDAWYKWRIPYHGYAYEPGRITVQHDNRATVAMGERELYYLSCIETKTHAAFFVTNKTDTTIQIGGQAYVLKGSGAQRKDAFEAYNTGDMEKDEGICGEGSGAFMSVNTALDADSASRFTGMNKRLGGRERLILDASDAWLSAPKNNRPNKSEFLERIVLLARNPDGGGYTEIVKTVNLEYSYEVMARNRNEGYLDNYEWREREGKNVIRASEKTWDTIYNMNGYLNSAVVLSKRGVYPHHLGTRITACRQGKLTLKRVWTDYGAVKSALITPYEFQYAYRNTRSEPYPSEITSNAHYLSLRQHDSMFTSSSLDADWKVDSATSKYQNPEYEPILIDPWGGYRPDGYWAAARMVHHLNQENISGVNNFDPAAWQLKIIRLPSGGEIHVQYEQNSYSYVQDQPAMALLPLQSVTGNQYVIDCSSLSGRNIADVRNAIAAYLARRERLYFKLLYPIIQCTPGILDMTSDYIPSSSSEYITGYVRATPGSPPSGNFARIDMQGSPTPAAILSEFLFNQSNEFRICENGNTSIDGSRRPGGIGSKETWQNLASGGWSINDNGNKLRSFVAAQPRPYLQRSYIRVPCLWKFGGGVRVKRIFMYDKGVEYGRAAVYGSEYDYTITENGVTQSSGVATNEPAQLREENPLVKFLIGREESSWLEKLAAGEDLEQFEGPLCPSVYPAATIGYRRVTVKNIVQTGSTPGFTVSEFNTAKEFPVVESWTALDSKGIGIPAIPMGPFSVQVSKRVASQGFAVKLNQMHGTVKRVRKCAGAYNSNESTWNVVEAIEHEYFKPGEPIPVLKRKDNDTTGTFEIAMKRMGVDMDLSMETRAVSDVTVTGSLPFDVGLSFPFLPYGHVAPPSVATSTTTYSFAVVTKVTTYSTFEKSVTVMRDGMRHTVENSAFDEGTGNPVVRKTLSDQQDNVDGDGRVDDIVVDFQVPAWGIYPLMGPRSFNENSQVLGTVATSGALTFTPNTSAALAVFQPGDLIHLTNTSPTAPPHAYAYVISKDATKATLAYAHGTTSTSLTTNSIATIVRSGRTNQLTAIATTVTRFGSLVNIADVDLSSSYVLAASATTYSDAWNYENLVDAIPYATEQTNQYEKGTKGKWRPDSSFVYRASTTSSFDGKKIGRSGKATFTPLSFSAPGTRDPSKWIKTSYVEEYNQHGDIAVERDALGIPSCAMFSHSSSVPSIIAKNAASGAAAFLSFEDASGATSSQSHTGKKSRALTTSGATLCTLKVNTRLRDAGLMVRAWVKGGASSVANCSIGVSSLGSPATLADVAGWRLLEWNVAANIGPLSSSGVKAVDFSYSGGSGLHIDDVRIQPLDAEATCYVYDAATLRLVAQFDDQHFAAIYKYDDQGRLKRKERETERGIVPLQEAHNNTPAIAYVKRNVHWSAGDARFSAVTPVDFGPLGPGFAEPRAQKLGNKFDALNIVITPERKRIRLFDSKEEDIPNLDSLVRSVDMPKMNANDSIKKAPGGRNEK